MGVGGNTSKPTVLECMLKNLKRDFQETMECTPGKLYTLCELEWPIFKVGWPSEGTLDVPTVRAVYRVILVHLNIQTNFPI